MEEEGLMWDNGSANAGFDLFDDDRDDERRLNASVADASDFIVDIREFDVPYHVRVMIDLGISISPSAQLLTNNFRYSDWEMVLSGSQTRCHELEMFRRETTESRSRSHGIRYRDHETPTQIPRRDHRSDYDDFVYD
jgi:DNA polymerase elongation subunit (family B)